MFYRFIKAVLGLPAYVLYRFRTYGRENLPTSGAFLIASNHESYVDPFFVAMATPGRHLRFMAKKELFDMPVLGYLAKCVKAFPVDRGKADRGSIHTAMELLKDGHAVALFPEGTRYRKAGFGRVKPGALALAKSAGVPLVPLRLSHTFYITRGILPWFPRITARFGHPLSPNELRDMDKNQFADWLRGQWRQLGG